MWLIVAILIIVILYLIKTSCEKAIDMDETDKITELINERDEYKALRLQEIHNNTVLLNKNKALNK